MQCSECIFGVYYAEMRAYDCSLSECDGEKCPNLQENKEREVDYERILSEA